MSGEKQESSFSTPRADGDAGEQRDEPGSSGTFFQRKQPVQHQLEGAPSLDDQLPGPSRQHGLAHGTVSAVAQQGTGLFAKKLGEATEPDPSFQEDLELTSSSPSILMFHGELPGHVLLFSLLPPVPEEAVGKQRTPCKSWKIGHLQHGRSVYATAISHSTQRVYTCGFGFIKVWDKNAMHAWDEAPLDRLDFQDHWNCVLTCKLLPDEQNLMTGGLARYLTLWDLVPTPRVKTQLPSSGPKCFSLVISSDARICLASFNGFLEIWDLQNQILIRKSKLPSSGYRCVDITSNKFWTGGEDAILCSWDLRTYQKLQDFNLAYEILGISHDPSEEWMLVGLKNSDIILQHTWRKERYKINMHVRDSQNHNLKFTSCGSFFVTTMDNSIYGIASPSLQKLFQNEEPSEILCCDMSSDNQYVITGLKDSASVYQLLY
ncbi:transducin-like enhancer protein 7 [Rhynchocyon petersi]